MAKHIHIHFAPRKRIGDQAPGSVPPSDLTPLVEALHAAIAARHGATPTQDADFDESKVKRDEGGRFSAQQHMDAAAKHHSDADTHKAAGNPKAAKAHTEAAMEHEMAAQHINAKTGWAAHRSQSAHNKSAEAAKLSASTPASLDQLKAQASDPKASIEQRAAAVSQLSKMEKLANTVAESPHAVPSSPTEPVSVKPDGGFGAHAIPKPPIPLHGVVNPTDRAQAQQALRQQGVTAPVPKPAATPTIAPGAPGYAQPAAGGAAPQAQPSGDKPTSAKASGAKAATHELLSSGHPFSVDELMKATGCSNRTTLMTALSDLKSPKYAGKLGALNIVKRPDGMYHVQKDDGKPLGKVESPARKMDFNQQGEQNLVPSIAGKKDEGSGTRTPNVPHYGGSTTGVKFGPVSKVGGVMSGLGPAGTDEAAAAGKDLASKGFEPYHAGSYGSAQEAVHAYKHPKTGEMVHVAKNHATGAVEVRPATQAHRAGPGGSTESQAAARVAANRAAGVPDDTGSGKPNRAEHQKQIAFHEEQAKTHTNMAMRGAHAEAADMHREGMREGHGSKESAAAHEMSQTLAKYKPGPGGGAALPMVNTEGGFSRNPVQNVQARMDAKAAVRSGQATGAAATRSGAGPSAPGTKTREQITHHQNMEAHHRAEADKIRASGIGNYKDHLRAAQLHANAANDYANGKGKGGWTPVSAGNANALSKNMGLDPLNTNSKPGTGTPIRGPAAFGNLTTLASRMGGPRAPIASPLKDFNDPSYREVEARVQGRPDLNSKPGTGVKK